MIMTERRALIYILGYNYHIEVVGLDLAVFNTIVCLTTRFHFVVTRLDNDFCDHFGIRHFSSY